ncbi:cell division protein DedD [Oceanisphaera marina]|uniref:Cell division protein DedD n=1 Tax=Oceanisphaera marina TaxID=2017550 RepID=A0ABQ1IPV9_9GAMM|nr:SPOR domain-containing protein [Oceanisphaera marina]GGB47833.1 cell division protein DedD [Oceanisphaera marina]
MATQFQQRLVGTVILVALGVIFLPDLLDGKQQLAPDEAVTIPLRPELEPVRPLVVAPEPAQAAQRDAEPEVWTIEEAREAPPVAPKPAAPAPQPQPEPQSKPAPVVKPAPIVKAAPVVQPAPTIKQVAPQHGEHVVQLGAFRNADNVNALVKKLQAAGYRAQTTPSVPRHGELNRVWVGPDDKARLEQQLAALERLTGLKGRIRAK